MARSVAESSLGVGVDFISSFYEWFAVMPWRGPVSLSRVGWQRAGCAAQTEFGITSEESRLEFSRAPIPLVSRKCRARHHPAGSPACRMNQYGSRRDWK